MSERWMLAEALVIGLNPKHNFPECLTNEGKNFTIIKFFSSNFARKSLNAQGKNFNAQRNLKSRGRSRGDFYGRKAEGEA
jgi:hypothetical protein